MYVICKYKLKLIYLFILIESNHDFIILFYFIYYILYTKAYIYL